ncbi:MAG: oxygen-independent coproporphyrinogen III oxidase [Lachnospiraceae bacterium]|nr:oxygen-independent coproporphyrinogen III oxidase [Lachnospiraceae bacterium]
MKAGIYIHIPFCKQKCLYCDFVSNCGSDEDMRGYQKALLNEIESTVINETVDSVFFGGGTPSIYPKEYIGEIMDLLKKKNVLSPDLECTIEANPGTLNYEKLCYYKSVGINRISIGLQSANDEELKVLGRIHTYDKFIESYELAKKAGFDNINIDLMSAIPLQTFESYKETLKKVVGLNPTHISAYSLIIEEGTPFYDKYYGDDEFEKLLPDEDTERKMYHYTKEFLLKKGYSRYEISNYSKVGYECKHNLKYWSRINYYGFGVAAASLVNNVRYLNTDNRKDYVQANGDITKIRIEENEILINEQMEEYMFLGLRKVKGISIKEFERIFEKNVYDEYGEVINKHLENGLLEIKENRIFLTDKGLDVSNFVMSDFLK